MILTHMNYVPTSFVKLMLVAAFPSIKKLANVCVILDISSALTVYALISTNVSIAPAQIIA